MNGVAGPIALDDAEDIALMLVALGRAIPPARWVESLKRRTAAKRSEGLPHNLV